MTKKTQIKLKKMNFLKQHRTTPRIAPNTKMIKYRIKQEETDENIYRFTRGSLRPQYI